ncbi:hypothetical protein BST92_03800 [Nonlabens arenilitoris]|uniref:Uncharacterized protein n=1 Tax=Nonlabens arenilitoris TaxID=1217969 RepID=A0A2S7U970_9FLAO|nr:hypothetical protein [Nonlabens arenilitoris]PQJ31101.1 hypothetical protein BST92_03800 [Nonlabens arenilitoris]
MDINKAIKICLLNGIKVFPEVVHKKFVVAIKEKGKPVKLSLKNHTSNTINDAIIATYTFLAKKLS